ncbi:GNAT family N-acetyltransferase [Vibrio viridaestus]|uniref:GNAT family N-acetyltransferase n=1 Tax=Vibrio viridaestus TaxID=2487322 RepID=A0A3N9TEV8_9VIBR|nr:GNAT family N-acetyltransferase [Vibrio viridaestus]RQW62767.1 GNAT family N-acetyltransferase [Vibrio viridaestus]
MATQTSCTAESKGNFVEIEVEKSNSIELASELTRSNMRLYYQARNIIWDQRKYEENWSQFENFDVKYQRAWIGIIRFSSDEKALYIRDIQISPKYQNLDIGYSCLSYALEKAKLCSLSRLRLLVFSENPALSLYKTFGFQDLGESDGLIKMEMFVKASTESSNPL